MVDQLIEFTRIYAEYTFGFLGSIFNSDHRLYFIYLISSLVFAYVIFRRSKHHDQFVSFLFPKHVWSHPTAMLDVRYFFFHGLTGHFLMSGIAFAAYMSAINITLGLETFTEFKSAAARSGTIGFLIALGYLIIMAIVSDFLAFFLHYMQHKVPVLWQFHKVHHSGEVMHPLSNFREHPVDNIVYKLVINFGNGLAAGLLLNLIGYKPTAIEIIGISVVSFAFNMTAYQLRHSHIWLRWPGVWSKIFPSPAHHQVHHSRHPDHLDKNFAFLFPIWDVIFGTYEMPEDNKDVEFGIVEDSSELNSCLNLYVIPFRDAYRVMKGTYKKDKAASVDTAKGEPVVF